MKTSLDSHDKIQQSFYFNFNVDNLKHITFHFEHYLRYYVFLTLILEPASDAVLIAALDIVCQEIGNQWDKIAIGMGTKLEIIDSISMQSLSTEEKMEKCFQYHRNNISWKKLKAELLKITRSDIIERIRKETLITGGIFLLLIAYYYDNAFT